MSDKLISLSKQRSGRSLWSIIERTMAVVGCIATIAGAWFAYSALRAPNEATSAIAAIVQQFGKAPADTVQPMINCSSADNSLDFQGKPECSLALFVDNLPGQAKADIQVTDPTNGAVIFDGELFFRTDGLTADAEFELPSRNTVKLNLTAAISLYKKGASVAYQKFTFSQTLAANASGDTWGPAGFSVISD